MFPSNHSRNRHASILDHPNSSHTTVEASRCINYRRHTQSCVLKPRDMPSFCEILGLFTWIFWNKSWRSHIDWSISKTNRLIFLINAYKYPPFLSFLFYALKSSLKFPCLPSQISRKQTQNSSRPRYSSSSFLLATMASFISKLSEECNKCKDIIDHCAIKAMRFESDSSASHQILGHLFRKQVPTPFTNLLKDYCLTPLRQGFEWSKWEMSKPQGAWPSTTAT